jgi:peptide/nickel transport system permease protein
MGALIARRLLSLIPILLLVSFVTFLLISQISGDAALEVAGGTNATKQRVREVRHELHLDDPWPERYARWLADASHLDFGHSLFGQKESVGDEIGKRLPITLSLVLGATLVGLLLGVPLGIASGLRPGSTVDKGGRVAATVGVAVPSFWLAVELVAVFAVGRRWFPPSGYVHFGDDPIEWANHVVLPSIALGVWSAASIARQLRSELIDVLDANYVRTAWAKGLPDSSVIARHVLKNAMIPVVTVMGLQLSALLGGTVIMESIFVLPGMGKFLLDAISWRDYPVIQGINLFLATGIIVLNLVIDVTYSFLDPRIRFG